MVKRDFKYGFLNIPVQQVPNALNVFQEFFKNESFEYVIEIGTSYGGLSLFLNEQSNIHNFKFITYDISDVRIKKAWLDNKIPFDYKIEDCFSTNTSNFIITRLKENKCLLLCDGGNKVKEFNFFSQFITSGSYIMAHDYSSDKNYFDKNIRDKVWNWLEIEDADIMSSVDDYNLIKPEYYEKFKDVVWVCYKK
jgi:cephalosporin hydroxylase